MSRLKSTRSGRAGGLFGLAAVAQKAGSARHHAAAAVNTTSQAEPLPEVRSGCSITKSTLCGEFGTVGIIGNRLAFKKFASKHFQAVDYYEDVPRHGFLPRHSL